ncbi:MAG: hypothetical protein E7378_02280 [Clostridiales bacterium]|nr:hypothetical protein [Clostridiales bacterium]
MRKYKIFTAVAALLLAISLLSFGVYASQSINVKVTSTVSFQVHDVYIRARFGQAQSVSANGGKYTWVEKTNLVQEVYTRNQTTGKFQELATSYPLIPDDANGNPQKIILTDDTATSATAYFFLTVENLHGMPINLKLSSLWSAGHLGSSAQNVSNIVATTTFYSGANGQALPIDDKNDVLFTMAANEIITIVTQLSVNNDYAHKVAGVMQFGLNAQLLNRDYERYEYIESSGAQYIDTGYVYQAGDKIAMGFAPLESNVDKAIFGAYESGTKLIELGMLQNSFRGNIAETAGLSQNYVVGQKYDVETENSTWKFVDGQAFGNASYITQDNTMQSTCYLFGRNYTDKKMSSIRFFYLKVYRGDELILDFFPCKYLKDGEYKDQFGLWDDVNNKFYPNAGTGTFSGANTVI